MAGYTRQSTADIIPTATVRAAPLNAEYNAIRDAFAASGGHKHDGTTAEGEYVPLISDLDNYNKVVIDSTNNRVGVFVEVSTAAVEQVRFQDGAIVPVTTNDIDLGTSLLKFKDLYIEGTSTIGTVDIDGGNIDGTVIGATTAAAADFTTMDASGNATVGGTFAVTGNTTVGGTLGVTGVTTLGTANITSVDLDSGAIDNTTIGATTAAAGTFTTLTANTSLTAATADINGGTLDGVIIGGTTSAAATVTDLTATGTSTLTTVDINGGAIDGTTIGASSAAAGSFTTVSTSGQATLATADINGGTIDGTTIGATTPAAITGTTVTATSFVGPVTGNVTGNLTGDVTGDLTGDVTGDITSTGSSSFNNVTIDGTLNMNAGTTATITNLTSPTNTNDAATKGYVDTEIANLVDSAPGTLDTLNELAAALDDDPNFSTTITNSIATKLPLAGGTMTGAIAMGTSKITGLGDPTAAQDAATKNYVDTNALLLSGGTMTGDINMGGSTQLTNLPSPTLGGQAANKSYVDSILGSATAASASAAAAATSESNAATSETNAATSASNAATSESNTATLYDNFDDRYLGAKASAPTVDNDGDALITGALYFNTTTNIMNVYGTSGWQSAGSAVNGTSDRQTYTATSGQTVFAATYDTGYVDVYLNGVKLLAGTDFTATNGTSITLASGAAVNDIVDIVAYGTFVLADHYSKSQSDARYVEVAGDTMTGDLDITGTLTSDGLTVDGASSIRHSDATTNISLTPTSTGGVVNVRDSSGNSQIVLDARTSQVGVGTDSPDVKFHVSGGNARIAGTEASGSFIDINASNTGSDGATLGVSYYGSGSYGPLKFSVGGSEVMRIGSGSDKAVMIGTTNTSPVSSNVQGISMRGLYGEMQVSSEGSTGAPLYLNRMTSDGDIAVFRKDGNTVGTVGAGSGVMAIAGPSGNGLSFPNNLVLPSTSTAGAKDASTDLGVSYSRFRDIHLSGTSYANNTQLDLTPTNGDSPIAVKIVNNASGSGTGGRVVMGAGSGSLSQTAGVAGFFDGAGTSLAFYTATNYGSTNQTERLRINRNGNVGIGTTSPTGKLSVSDPTYLSSTATLGSSITLNSENTVSWTGTRELISFESVGNGADHRIGTLSIKLKKGSSDTTLTEYMQINAVSNYTTFSTAGSERMRITSGGGLSLGTTGLPTSGNAGVSLQPAGNVHCGVATVAATDVMRFDNPNGRVGSIYVTGTSTSYNTSSDYRLKENITDVTDGITRVKQLAPKRFNFIADPDTIVDGFIAHEVQDVIPEAISGAKDAMRDEEYEVTPAVLDDDGNVVTDAVMGTRSVPDYQGIDQSKLVPLLTAALQEAIAKIETLETEMTSVKARLDALEAN